MNLIQAIFAVGLVALVTVGGIQYASPDSQTRARITTEAEGGFGALEGAYRARQSTGAPPLATTGWEKALFPTYGQRPAAVHGLDWSYSAAADGTWFCLSGPLKDAIMQAALEGLSKRSPAGLYDVTRDCGGAGGSPAGRVAATLWMERPQS